MADLRNQTVSFRIGDDVIDIPTMHTLSEQEYRSYIDEHLYWVDHHDVLRAVIGDYSIATNRKQIEQLIDYLNEVKLKMPK